MVSRMFLSRIRILFGSLLSGFCLLLVLFLNLAMIVSCMLVSAMEIPSNQSNSKKSSTSYHSKH
jgi:hypothetical protein